MAGQVQPATSSPATSNQRQQAQQPRHTARRAHKADQLVGESNSG